MLLKTETLILPESKIKCEIGLSAFDRLEVQKQLAILTSFSREYKAVKEEGDEREKHEMVERNSSIMREYFKTILLCGIKSWDRPEPPTWELLQTIEEEDMNIVEERVMDIYLKSRKRPDTGEDGNIDQKKSENTSEQSTTEQKKEKK